MTGPVEIYTETETGQKADVLLNDGVRTPLKLALIISGLVFVFIGLAFDDWKTAALTGIFIAICVLSFYLKHWFNLTAGSFMPLVNTQKNGREQEQASKQGEPLHIVFSVSSVTDSGGLKQERYDWPIKPSQMQALSERTLEGEQFTEANFLKGKGKIFTPREFLKLREYLIGRLLLEKIDPGRGNSGFKWSVDAIDLMQRLVSEEKLQ